MQASDLVPEELWEAVEPLLPRERPKPKGGRPRVPDRSALAGIVFVLRHGCRWRDVPRALGASGVSCWRRLREWQKAGVWMRAHRTILQWLGDLDAIDLERASLDSSSVRAKKGVRLPARIRPIGASVARSIT
jgi:transposase